MNDRLPIYSNSRMLYLGLTLAFGLASFIGLLLAVNAVQPVSGASRIPAPQTRPVQNDAPDKFPIITGTASYRGPGISGDCVAFRDENGRVYLYNLTTHETLTITDKPDALRKVVISQGVVVWRSDRAGEMGLWGYYNPACSDAGPFTATETITSFHIISRTTAQAPALSGEMLTFDTWAPKGDWYVLLIELDTDNNGIPDAIEDGYDPTHPISVPVSPPYWQGPGIGQRVSDIYWDDDYRLACWYDNTGHVERIECNDLFHLYDPNPWNYRFTVTTSTWIPLEWQGILAIYRDLVIWRDARDSGISGYDLYIADLDLDDDRTLNHEDTTPGEGPAVLTLIDNPWPQSYPDIWWPFAVWTDWRNGSQADIYAYDLSLDSDGNGTLNWRDANRHCIDPAEFRVTFDPATQTTAEVWGDTVVWEERSPTGDWGIYGAPLEPRQPIPSTPEEKALYWLDQQTVRFTPVRAIPGYVAATGTITRYKSFTQTGTEHVRRAWYSPTLGSYVVSYDFCRYGTPDQKTYLGRYGRGFIYDQGLALIARTMFSQSAEAEDLAGYVSSFQNSGQLTTTTPGSFGFSFNGQGNAGERDNFYDMDYLRTGANAWMGYGLLFYARQYSDTQFTDVITRVADYILDHQVLTQTDARYGLFTGGYGGWITQTDVFADEHIEWVATEHNIDTYFFLRDLGQMTGESRYADAAELLRANMPKLWDEENGRLHQGMDRDGTLNTGDALDAASWGAMYWVAVGDFEKAMRSLEYADHAYSNTVTVSSTLSIWGYKPYSGTAEGSDWSGVDVVWSEGSLGVAMAHLKLGHALLDRGDSAGDAYIQQAHSILAEMEELQTMDPRGGMLYGISQSGTITDFPEAPSAAGTTWLLMVQRAAEDATMRDAFWGPDPEIIRRLTITGPTTGSLNALLTFTATVSPIEATLPITYIWQVTEQFPVTYTGGLSSTATFSWYLTDAAVSALKADNPKDITVTAINDRSIATGTHAIAIHAGMEPGPIYLPIIMRNH